MLRNGGGLSDVVFLIIAISTVIRQLITRSLHLCIILLTCYVCCIHTNVGRVTLLFVISFSAWYVTTITSLICGIVTLVKAK
jgi:hypothetical protein